VGAVAAVAAWWLVRAPAIEHHAVRPPPDLDIDPPAMRARREAAFKLALMPDDPWTLAESLAASAAETPASKPRCGVDQAPRAAGAATEGDQSGAGKPAKPAGPGYLAEMARLDTRLRTSVDPFDHAVADWLNVGGVQGSAQAVEALAQRAMTTADARIYALAFRACQPSSTTADASAPRAGSCAALSVRRWVELDPDNAAPWLFAFSQAVTAGDATGQQEAMTHMASASRFDDRLYLPAGAVAAHASGEEDMLAADYDLSRQAFQKTVGLFDPIGPLMQACRDKAGGDANRAQECEAIGDLMADHGDSLLLQVFGGALHFQATGDASRRERYRAERAELGKHWSPATGMSECQVLRDDLKSIARSAQIGELAAARERVREDSAP
jgi:hypothetical protein